VRNSLSARFLALSGESRPFLLPVEYYCGDDCRRKCTSDFPHHSSPPFDGFFEVFVRSGYIQICEEKSVSALRQNILLNSAPIGGGNVLPFVAKQLIQPQTVCCVPT
jgi:hypothetical protein